MRIPAKHRQFAFVLAMSLMLTFIMSGIMTYVLEGGFIPHFMRAWMKDWGVAFVVAYGLNLFLPGKVRRLTSRFNRSRMASLVAYAFAISLIMTFILSFVMTAVAMNGFGAGFAGHWMVAWPIAFCVVFALNFFLPQGVGRIVDLLIAKPGDMPAGGSAVAKG